MSGRAWRTAAAIAAGIAITAGSLLAAPAAQADNGAQAIGQPTATAAVIAGNVPQLTLAWTKPAPVTAGDDTVTGFLVYSTPALTGLSNPYPRTLAEADCSADTSCQVVFPAANLTIGTSYTFTVAAITTNVPGGSGNSVASAAKTVFVAPGPPTGVSVVPGNDQLGVSWTAPSSTGGLDLTGYMVTTSPASAGCSTSASGATPPATTCTVTGLTDDSTYTITVTATNGSAISDPSTPVTGKPLNSITAPGAPTIGTATAAGPTSVSVAFTAPANTGGSPISGYTATCTPTAGLAQSATGTASPIIVGSLVTGTAYTCKVLATNIQGNSALSAASNSVTPVAVPAPGVPTSVTGVPGDTAVALTWTAPTAPPAATGYQIQYSANSGTTWLPATPLSSATTSTAVTGLTNGTAYVFRVRALNGVVEGTWSATSAAVTPGTPGAPTAVTATPGLAQATVSWTAPTGALTPTSYQVRYSSNSGTSWTEVTPTGTTAVTATVTGLTNGTGYVFAVRAIRGAAVGAWSTLSAAITPGTPGVPGVPTGVAGNAQVVLSWTAPATAATTPVPTGYQVRFSSNGGSTWTERTAGSTALTQTITGLTNGTAYVFSVRAVNGPVLGTWTANSAAVTPRAPVGTITIEGERGTGNDSNRVYVTGVTTNLVGQKVIPYYRFPGQTGFTAGTGERTVDANGQFSWQRKTGKRIVVQFRYGDLRSNNVKIDAK